MKQKNRKSAGFTLIELVVVMAIVAVLAAMMVAAIAAARRMSIDNARAGALRTIDVALEEYANKNNGHYPYQSTTGITAVVTSLTSNNNSGPFLSTKPLNLDDTYMIYKSDGSGTDGSPTANRYTLVACDWHNFGTPSVTTAGDSAYSNCSATASSGAAYLSNR